MAIALVVIAALLDGVDGRLARALKAQSKFGPSSTAWPTS